MQKFLCKIGLHDYVTIDCTDHFTTTYTDQPSWKPIRHMVWYQQCVSCSKRRLKDTHKKDSINPSSRHNGIEYARVAWVTYGKMALSEGRVITPTPPPPIKQKPKLKLVDGGKNE